MHSKRGRVLITAGPTREKIDPVRFISNYSTGVFGYKLAQEALRRGFEVTLISGPTCLVPPRGAKFIKIESALDMRREVLRALPESKYVIMSAAVSDWRPKKAVSGKIKRSGFCKNIELVENPDILKEVGRKKGDKVVVGFALETGDLEKNAVKKLISKNVDIIVANMLSSKADLFGDKAVDIVIIDIMGNKNCYTNKSKENLAKIILDKVFTFNI